MMRMAPFELCAFCDKIDTISLSALGPQISFKSFVDLDGDIIPSKSITELIGFLSDRYPYGHLLIDILDSFHGVVGTVSFLRHERLLITISIFLLMANHSHRIHFVGIVFGTGDDEALYQGARARGD